MGINTIYNIDCLRGMAAMPDNSIDCIITSPPYWNLRDYDIDGQLGLEPDFELYIGKLIELFHESKRVLKDTGTLWVNIGDTYNGNKHGNDNPKNQHVNTKTFKKSRAGGIAKKSLLMLPSRFALAMIADGWILRNEIIWHKPNQMPQSAADRFTVDFEKIFFFTQQPMGYYFKQQKESCVPNSDMSYRKTLRIGRKYGVKRPYKDNQPLSYNKKPNVEYKDSNIPTRNMRAVWQINTKPYSDAHFAVYPEKLVGRMITAGCPEDGVVLDPFMGSGTTALVALKTHRQYVGFELNEDYIRVADRRLAEYKNQAQLF